jgi:hypothetical protein
MSSPSDRLERPRRATFGDSYSVRLAALGQPEAKLCFLLPLGTSIVVFLVAIVAAPDMDSQAAAGRFSAFFSTSAQVIVTLLVALALEARTLSFRQLNARRLIVGGTLSYVVVGAVAAVLALNPTLGADLYTLLFALTCAAGMGALLSVLTVSYRVLETELQEWRGEGAAQAPPGDSEAQP